ncbi:hypothetical protein [Fusobacterium ulcerans]|uniref:hypothetical protein n=1 Tax=Fusobacterium ulcerans TaxID=861 RepID=UPI0024200962|nr:hypothetical protein [Fusobacterium ulcerans]
MIIEKNSLWINNKNGREYQAVNEAIDCTNERDGLIVVVYICKEAEGKLFVREKSEFLKKILTEEIENKVAQNCFEPPCFYNSYLFFA